MQVVLLVIHVIACVGLIAVVLIQRGRGGGLVENLSGLESVFGTKTSAVLTRATTILAVAFFLTCLLLAAQSAGRSRSLMRGVQPLAPQPGQGVPAEAVSPEAAGETGAAAVPAAAHSEGAPAEPAAAAAETQTSGQ